MHFVTKKILMMFYFRQQLIYSMSILLGKENFLRLKTSIGEFMDLVEDVGCEKSEVIKKGFQVNITG